jgi:hypothetical protein
LLAAGETVTGSFTVSAADVGTIRPLWLEGTATFNLRDPAGQVLLIRHCQG